MKIQIVSDLHLEFNTDITVNNAGAEGVRVLQVAPGDF